MTTKQTKLEQAPQLQRYSGMARILDCTERHLANLVKQKKVPVIRMGTSVRFDPGAVIQALAEG